MTSNRPASVRTTDGWLLRGEVSAEGSMEKPVALLLHAMMANRKSMDRPRGAGLASVLAGRDFGVVSFDLRGHGESGPSARDGARYSYDDYVLRDIPALVEFVRQEFAGRPVVVVGHSLGAHASLAASGVFPEKAPDGIVSIAGNMWVPSCEPDKARRAAKTAMLAAFLGMAETWGYFDPRPLRFGTDAVALPYVRQFWTMWSSNRYGSTDGSIDYREALGRVTIPVFSVASEADTLLAHPVSVELFLRPIPEKQKTLRVISGRDFGAPAPDHMGLVTDARSRPVWNEIADWIESEPGFERSLRARETRATRG
ncbi:MAG: alpha/beta fold hydrolase [Polyangiaceae bacterium]|nr:alpha/beta fold hydrolase [Polyangiaceae bacterium]